MESRFIRNLDQKVEQGSFYDALQLCRAIFDRFGKRKDIEGGLAFAEKYAEVFAEHAQHELTVNLANRTLQLLEDCKVVPSEDMCVRLATMFLLCPPGSSSTKYEFMDRLIAWSKQCPEYQDTEQAAEGLQTLHSIIAEAYLSEGQFGACQGHLVFCDDVDTMLEMLAQWTKQGYPSERYFFPLRLVCVLLSRGRVEVAGKLIERLPYNFDQDLVPGPLQAAYMLWAACAENNLEFFETVSRRYTLIFRVDGSFERLLKAIESTVFHVTHQPTGMMAMLQNLMGQPPAIGA